MPSVIVSYDGTRDDRDALALGRLFANAGGEISLAYVRHAIEPGHQQEAAAHQEAERLLARGAGLLGDPGAARHVIVNASTAEGLAALAVELNADVIAFGSSYRTPDGRVELPHTVDELLDRGIACSVALAPAGLWSEPVQRSVDTVSVYDEDEDQAALATGKSLAYALGAVVGGENADLLVVSSRAETPAGRLLLSGRARERIEEARCPVLALARGAALQFA